MSKSKDNTVPMLAGPEELWSRIRTAVTDPARVRKNDPGNPHVCNVFALHEFFTQSSVRADIEIRCQTANLGCVDCKQTLSDNVAEHLEPVREKVAELKAKPDQVLEILADGATRARKEAERTMSVVCERMGLGRKTLSEGIRKLTAQG